MKREELTKERQKELQRFEHSMSLRGNAVLTDLQVEEYNKLCDEYPKNKLDISPFKYADLLQKAHKMFTILDDYTSPEDEIRLSNEQFLKRLYILNLKWYRDDLSKEIEAIEEQFQKEIHQNKI